MILLEALISTTIFIIIPGYLIAKAIEWIDS